MEVFFVFVFVLFLRAIQFFQRRILQCPHRMTVSCFLAFCCAGGTESPAVQFHRKQPSCSLKDGVAYGRGYSVTFWGGGGVNSGGSLVPTAVSLQCLSSGFTCCLRWHLSPLLTEDQPVPVAILPGYTIVSTHVIYYSPSTCHLKMCHPASAIISFRILFLHMDLELLHSSPAILLRFEKKEKISPVD